MRGVLAGVAGGHVGRQRAGEIGQRLGGKPGGHEAPRHRSGIEGQRFWRPAALMRGRQVCKSSVTGATLGDMVTGVNLPAPWPALRRKGIAPDHDTGYLPGARGRPPVFTKTYHATHPDMMDGRQQRPAARPLPDRRPVRARRGGAELLPQRALRDRRRDAGERRRARCRTRPSRPRAAGHPFLERRELGVVNVAEAAGQGHRRRPGLHPGAARLPLCADGLGGRDVREATRAPPSSTWSRRRPTPASRPSRSRIAEAVPLERGVAGDLQRADDLPAGGAGHLQVGAAAAGPDDPETGSVWNTMPPHLHDRRREVYFYFGLKPRTSGCSTSWASRTRRATS